MSDNSHSTDGEMIGYEAGVSSESLELIRVNECDAAPGLVTSRFRALWNEIVRLRVELNRCMNSHNHGPDEMRDRKEALGKLCDNAQERCQRLLGDIEGWRNLLWLNHARYLPYEHGAYGDDGEMQCCGIDFKRWSLEQIDEHLGLRRIALQQKE